MFIVEVLVLLTIWRQHTVLSANEECLENWTSVSIVCKGNRKFKDASDPTCTHYYVCTQYASSYIITHVSCPTGTYFDVEDQACSKNFTCATTPTYVTSDSTTNNNLSTTTLFPMTTLSTPDVTLESDITGSTKGFSSTTPSEIAKPRTSTLTDLTTLLNTTSVACLFTTDPDYFECTATGRYPNLNDVTCVTYFLCSLLRNGSYLKTKYSCPPTSYFHQETHVCDTSYNCPCRELTTVSPLTSTARASTDTESTVEVSTEPTEDTAISTVTGSSTAIVFSSTVPTALEESSPLTVTTVLSSHSTLTPCLYNGDPDYFVCTSIGRYPNINDPTCETYFLCSLLRSGSYLKTKYSCPPTSYFHQERRVCDTTYRCPCRELVPSSEATSSTTESTVELSTEPTLDTGQSMITESSTGTFLSSTVRTESTELSTSASTIITVLSNHSTPQICLFNSDPDYFECSATGRYPNLNDPTCETYFLCSLLKNGSFRETKYSCPPTSYFNQQARVCDTSYSCPCKELTTAPSTKVTTEPATDIEPSTPTKYSTVAISSNGTPAEVTKLSTSSVTDLTTASNTTSASCLFNTDPEYFTCIASGRYPNLNDLTCETYFLCSLLRNGSYLKTKYSCPPTSYFHQGTHVCDTNYRCPCKELTPGSEVTSYTTESIVEHSTEPTLDIGQSTTIEFSTGTFLSSTVPTEITESISSTVKFITDLSTHSTIQVCLYNSDPDYFECSAIGRYPNLNDPTCETYFLCSLMRNGSFMKTKYSCPPTSYFNQQIYACDTTYNCPCRELITVSPLTSTPKASTDTKSTVEVSTEPTDDTVTSSVTGSSTATVFSSTVPTGIEEPSPLTVPTVPSSDTTLEPCLLNSDPDYFVCTSTGRYPNLNDPTCETYFLCSLLRNGSYLKTKYSCPPTAYFHQETHVCDTTYTCPCRVLTTRSETISTTESTVELSKEPSTDTGLSTITESSTATVLSSTVLTEISELSTVTIITDVSTHSTPEVCIFNKDPEYFECSATGRYPNLNDPTCETYFLCSLLRNGSFTKTKYSCPPTSYFNQQARFCDTSYGCPCKELTTTPSTKVTTEPATEIGPSTPTKSSTVAISSSGTPSEVTKLSTSSVTDLTTVSNTTTESCLFNTDPEYFTCIASGRYPNLNDLTCETYFLCSLLRNGSYLKTKYSCPPTSYFHQGTHVCDTNYRCPCKELTPGSEVTSYTTESIVEHSTEPTLDIGQSTTIEFSTGTFLSSTVPTEITEPSTSASTVITVSSTHSTSEVCLFYSDPDYFECSATGRYPNLNDATCETYLLCSLLRNGSFQKTKYGCPPTSYFNQQARVCDTSYSCPCRELTTPSTKVTTEPATDIEPSTLTKYSTVAISSNGTPAEVTKLSTSSVTDLTTASNTTSASCLFNTDPEYFTCIASGRYPNLNDLTCETYFLCSLLRNGSYLKTKYSCPPTSYFHQGTHVCDTNYRCPCKELTPGSEVTSYTTESIVEHSTEPTLDIGQSTTIEFSTGTFLSSTVPTEITESISSTVKFITDLSTHSTIQVCLYNSDPDYFECSAIGRYPNLNDPTCETYFLCSLMRNGSFMKTKYSCPPTSYFNQQIYACDTTYNCPCRELITVSPLTSTPKASTDTESTVEVSTEPTDDTVTSSVTGSSTATVFSSTVPTGIEEPSPLTVPTVPSSDTTLEPCLLDSDPDYFVCTSTGRYPNLNDPTCETYFLCSLLRNGSFLKTKYSCPPTAYFHQETHVCDTTYTCPCRVLTTRSETISTTESTVELSKEPSTDTGLSTITESSTATVLSSTVLTEISELSTVTIITDVSTHSTSEVCIFNNDPEYFECSATGRYPNLNDPTCETYFLCSLLRNGSFTKTKYSCPPTSYFNQQARFCDTSYSCPCKELTTTPSTKVTTEPATDIGPSTPTKSSTVAISSSATPSEVTKLSTSSVTDLTTVSNTTTESCLFNTDPEYFTCIASGRYPNLNDLTCETYFLCSLLRNGSYLKTIYSCPPTSYFHQETHVCDTNYRCPCEELTTRSEATSSTTESAVELSTEPTLDTGQSAITESSTGTFLSSIVPTEVTEPITSTVTLITDLSTHSTPQVCVFNNDPDYFECSATGRYPNLNDPTCETYFLCSLLRNGSFTKTKYTCPPTSYFNQQARFCDTSYGCPCKGLTSASSTEVTTETVTDIGSSTPTKSSTAAIFSSTTPSEVTTRPSTSAITDLTTVSHNTTEPCLFNTDPDYFECTAAGRYPNLNDLTCETYFLCSLLRSGSYMKTKYSCPPTSYFHQERRVCDTTYRCPCKELTPGSEATSYTTESTVEHSTEPTLDIGQSTSIEFSTGTFFSSTVPTEISESSTSASTVITVSSTHSTPEVCLFNSDPDYFECSATGRYPNLNDPTCETYFLCSLLRNDFFKKTRYSCPPTSYFNQQARICDTSYSCPCKELTTPSTKVTTEPATDIGTSTLTKSSTGAISSSATPSEVTKLSTSSVTDLPTVSNTTTESCLFNTDPEYFTCIASGRYPNLNDLTCETYFLCSLLRNGSYLKTKYSCPPTSYFHQETHVCDTNYRCPCKELTTRSEATSSTTESTVELSTEPTPDTGQSTITESSTSTVLSSTSPIEFTEATTSTLTITTTLSSHSTPKTCLFNADPDYFECNSTGRYPNLNDPTCETYFLCSLLRNGSFLKTKYSCPHTSYFHQETHVCDTTYTCPCSESTTVPSVEFSTGPTTDIGISTFPDSSLASDFTSTIPTSQASETTEPSVTRLSSSTVSSSQVTPGECAFNADPNYFECTAIGRYPNLNDLTCETYFLCSLLRNGSYMKTKYSCSPTSYFNQQTRICDTSYNCPCVEN